MLIDNFTEPKRILSYNEGKLITKKEYMILKKMAENERKKINYSYDDNSIFIKKLVRNITNNTDYDELSALKKEVLLANIVLPDDFKIIDILTANGYTIEHIKTIIRFRDILKNLILNNSILTKELNEQIDIYKKTVSKLICIFDENFHIKDSTIILNKLCEILVNYPELLETYNYKTRKLNK